MKERGVEYPQLRESWWPSDLGCLYDIFEHMEELNSIIQGNGKKYKNMISALDIEFTRRFGDFYELSGEFDILQSIFTSDFEQAPAALQFELIDLQCDITLKEKFESESIEKFYAFSTSQSLSS
ncbi:hypothetical protein RF11_07559 [Thelohanellus kitauei]|uniref:Uncharacterized protein n=1 Tax=Thelohanellus kitauei TaxID=669202 RepID=A0A0C2MRY0_THEKT|nr:hypothetical protein RF11_07559 [Thelohanellus kitauei]